MGELDQVDFGADTDAIRRWLAKRETYAGEVGDPVRGGKHRQDPPGTVDPQRLSVPDTQAAGRDVLDALVEPDPPVARRWPSPYKPEPKEPPHPERPQETAPASTPASTAASTAASTPASTPASTAGPTATRRPRVPSPYASTPAREEEVFASRSTNAVFKPRNGGRNLVTGIVVLAAVATAGAGYLAYRERTNISYGLVAILGILTVLVWAVRATTSRTELAVIRGQLEMIRDGRFEVIDLASPYTPVLVEGRPGRRGWRVSIERQDQPLLVIDASVVDPQHFMAVLQRVRPELRARG